MADEGLELAYDAATRALAQQDTSLGNLRTRAIGLLSAAAVITSFSSGLGLVNTDPAKGKILPVTAALLLVLILVAIGWLSMVVVWPVGLWHFGPDSAVILRMSAEQKSVDEIRRFVAQEMTNGRSHNARELKRRIRYYQWSVTLLLVEVIVLVVSFLIT